MEDPVAATPAPSPLDLDASVSGEESPRGRLALALTPRTEATFVALVTALGHTPAITSGAVTLVVPALEVEPAERRVLALLGPSAPVLVEAVADYLTRGHHHAALVGDDAAAIGRSAAGALRWAAAIQATGADEQAAGLQPSPPAVVAQLAEHQIDEPPEALLPTPFTPSPAVRLDDGCLLVPTAWGGRLLTLQSDQSLTPDLAVRGVHDGRVDAFLARVLGPGDVALDAGAGVGYFTLRMVGLVGPAGAVLAFEPDPRLHELLERNLALQEHAGAVGRAFRVAAYSHRTELTIASPQPAVAATDAGTVVEARPLDDHLADVGQVSLIRLGVGELLPEALDGLHRTVHAARVDYLVLHLEPGGKGSGKPLFVRLHEMRQRYGAAFATLDGDGLPIACSLEAGLGKDCTPHLIVALNPSPHHSESRS